MIGGGRLLHHAAALASSAIGVAGVMGLVLLMNDLSSEPPPAPTKAEASFDVDRKPKPKRKRQRPKPRKRVKPQPRAPKAPPPQVASAVTGVDVGLPGLGGFDLGASTKDLLGDAKPQRNLPMSASAVDDKPRCRLTSQLQYPRAAQAKGVEGKVVLSVLVDENGNIRRSKVHSSTPAGVFDSVAAGATFSCEPGRYQGEPVSVWVRIPLDFKLK